MKNNVLIVSEILFYQLDLFSLILLCSCSRRFLVR